MNIIEEFISASQGTKIAIIASVLTIIGFFTYVAQESKQTLKVENSETGEINNINGNSGSIIVNPKKKD